MNTIKRSLIIIMLSFLLISCSKEKTIINNDNDLANKPVEQIILALWDSLTAWYNLEIEKSYPSQLKTLLDNNWYNYKITNAWVSWDTSEWLLNRIDLYDYINADLYLLNIWSNDALRRLSIVDMKDNIQKIIDHIKSINTEAKIVLFWMQMPINFWVDYANDFSKTFSDLSVENNLYYYDFFLEWVAKKSSLNLIDWIHPNEKWYSIISNNIFKYLEDFKLIIK